MSVIMFLMNNLRFILFNLSGVLAAFIILSKVAGIRYKLSTTVLVFILLWIFRCFVFALFIINYLSNIYGEELWYHNLLYVVNIIVIVLGILYVKFLFKGNLAKNLLLFIGIELGLIVFSRVITYIMSLIWPSYDYQEMMNHSEIQDLIIPFLIIISCFVFLRHGERFFDNYRNWEPAHPFVLQLVLGSYLIFGIFTNLAMALIDNFEEKAFIIFYTSMIIMLSLYYWFDYYRLTQLRESARHKELLRQESALIAHYEDSLKQASRISQFQEEIREMMMKLMEKVEEEKNTLGENSSADFYQGKENLDQMIHEYLNELKEQRDSLSVMKFCSDYTLDQFLIFHEKRLRDIGYITTMHFQDYQTPPGIMVTDVIEILHWMTTGILPEVTVSDSTDEGTGIQQPASYHDPLSEEPVKGRITYQGAVIGQMLVLHCEAEGQGVRLPRMSHIRHIKKRIKVDIDLTAEPGRMRALVGLPL